MKKTLQGTVVSVKMSKTVVVEVVRRVPHPLYRKLLKKSKRFKADTNNITVSEGDMVEISETHPVAADKHFKLEKIIRPKDDKII